MCDGCYMEHSSYVIKKKEPTDKEPLYFNIPDVYLEESKDDNESDSDESDDESDDEVRRKKMIIGHDLQRKTSKTKNKIKRELKKEN